MTMYTLSSIRSGPAPGGSVRRRFGVSSLGLLAGSLIAPAFAQAPAAPTPQTVTTNQAAQSADDQDAGDRIIVTARRREESLQNIPVSGTVITEQEILDVGGFTSEEDFGLLLTGVTVDLNGNQEFFIRGAGTGVTQFTSSATTQFRNGAEVAGGFGGRGFERMDYFDSRQTEVYRGAQGALYGRNAVGGVVVINNNDPRPDFGYSLTSQYDFDQKETRVDAVINTPLIEDRLFFRAGVAYQDGDGFYRNEFYGGTPFDNTHFGGARVGLKALITEKLDATLIVDYGETTFDSLYATSVASTVPGAFFTAIGNPRDLSGNPLPDRDPATTGLQVGVPGNRPGEIYRQAFDTPGSYDEGTLTGNLRVNFELPFAVAQSITGYRQRDYDLWFDADKGYVGGVLRNLPAQCGPTATARVAGPINIAGVNVASLGRNATNQFTLTGGRPATADDLNGTGRDPAGVCANSTDSRTNIFTQEVRLVSPTGERLTWLLGADFRRFDNPVNQLQVGRNPSAAAAVNTTTGAPNTLQANNINLVTRSFQENYGAYASVGYDLTDWLNLAASVRYSNDNVKSRNETFDLDRVRGFVAAAGANSVPTTRGNVAGGSLILNRDYGQIIQRNYGSETFSKTIPAIYAGIKLPNQQLVYGSVGQGYRAGGFNRISGTLVSGTTTLAIPAQYDEETADAYEIGYKGGLRFGPGRRIDYSAAIFHTRYSNFINTATIVTGGEVSDDPNPDAISDLVAYNLGDAYVQGVEADFRFNWSDLAFGGDNFNFRGGLTWGESKALSGPERGNELNFVRTWTYNGTLTYRAPITDMGMVKGFFLSTNFNAEIDTDNRNVALDQTLVTCSRTGTVIARGTCDGTTRGSDTRRTVNARGGFEGEIGENKWQLAVFADNVFDVSYDITRPTINATNGYSQNDPFSMGVRFSISR
jgi:outer membrane receptor protein involved in Fe transport